MRTVFSLFVVAAATLCLQPAAVAQRHNEGSSPPTAPVAARNGARPILPASSGMGAVQFVVVNYGVPAPQSLTRQLEDTDDRTRAAALSAIGAPAQYLEHGHIPYPQSIQLNFAALGTGDELDAILTVELDQHIVSAILLPQEGNWRRIATILFTTPFKDPTSNPGSFVRLDRSLLQQEHYRAVYRALTPLPNGDFAENEAQLRILNGRAVIITSFVDAARTCPTQPANSTCEVIHRWMQPDPADPTHRLLLVTATGRLTPQEAAGPLASSAQFRDAHARSFSCQPFVFSTSTLRYEPAANSAPCPRSR